MEKRIKKVLFDCCITSTDAIKEMGISRNAFYLFQEKNKSKYEFFIDNHLRDFRFTPDKLRSALDISGMTQLEVSSLIGVHNVTFNLFLSGKLRPSRNSGDWMKIRVFCEKYML